MILEVATALYIKCLLMSAVIFLPGVAASRIGDVPSHWGVDTTATAGARRDAFFIHDYLPTIKISRPILPPVYMNDRQPLSVKTIDPQKLRPYRAAAAGVICLSANAVVYQKFKNIWWNHPTTNFHLYRGWRQTEGWYDFGPHDSLWFHMDKLGHYYNAQLLSVLLRDTAGWVGFDSRNSGWIGALSSWLFMLEIELFDSRYEEWGFSLGDMLANTAGAMMPMMKEKSPFLKQFVFKWSYRPTSGARAQDYLFDDYGSMTFWLCSNPDDFLPDALRSFWPGFLNLTVGYGITEKACGEIEWYIGLDYDLTRIQTRKPVLKKILTFLNYIHFPAPSFKISPQKKFEPFSF